MAAEGEGERGGGRRGKRDGVSDEEGRGGGGRGAMEKGYVGVRVGGGRVIVFCYFLLFFVYHILCRRDL